MMVNCNLSECKRFNCVTLCLDRRPYSQMPLYVCKIQYLHACAEVRMSCTHFRSLPSEGTRLVWFSLLYFHRGLINVSHQKLGLQLLTHSAFHLFVFILLIIKKNIAGQNIVQSVFIIDGTFV